MKRPIFQTSLAVLLAVAFMLPAWSADAATDAAQVKQQASELQALQKSAAQAAGWKALKLRSAAHQLTVTVTGSTLATPAEREAHAAKIVAAVEAGIENKPAFAQITVIHVDYVKPAYQGKSAVQGFDYYQTPAGAFVPHKT